MIVSPWILIGIAYLAGLCTTPALLLVVLFVQFLKGKGGDGLADM
jgi:hypothetical protein